MKKILFSLSVLFLFTKQSYGQVSGTVYWDLNNDGGKSLIGVYPVEKGVYGISVKAYNTTNTMVASTTTNSDGEFSMPGVTTFPVRLEFTMAADIQIAKHNSNVQFITASTINANLGIVKTSNYAGSNNPWVVSNAFSNGNALAAGAGEAGLRQNLMVFPYTLDNTKKSGANYQNRWLGAVFGITSQRETGTVLMASYLKRHASFGPGGIDAIYKTVVTASGDASQPAVLFNLASLGINVGTDPRTVTLPSDASVANVDNGVFAQIGKVGIGNIDMADNGKDLFVTNLFQNKIHRINVGMPIKNSFSAADVTGNWLIPGPALAGTEWHIMSVKYYEGKVYIGGITSKQRTDPPIATQADLDADHVNLRAYVYELNPSNGVITEVLQVPLGYRRGNVIGQFRYEFKDNWWRAWQNNGNIDVVRNDFNVAMEAYPQPAAPYNTFNNTGLIYPQPMLSDIEFDADGSMIIALRDRFGDQGGVNNYFEGINGTTPSSDGNLFRVFATGDILRAGKNGATWSIENNAVVNNNGVLTDANAANIQGTTPASTAYFSGTFSPMSGIPWGYNSTVNKGFGPGGRYYYYNHALDAAGVPLANIQGGVFNGAKTHYSKSIGGLAMMPANDELMQTTMSPEGRTFSSGVIRLSNRGLMPGTNAGNMTDQEELVPTTNLYATPDAFGKANAMGDVEILGGAMAIEIGNRVWMDEDGNGRQDANEDGAANVTVWLRSPGADGVFGNGDDQLWSTTTDAKGHYYFDNSIVNDNRRAALNFIGLPANSGILNNQSYRLEIDLGQVGLSAYTATFCQTSNENIDSDGTLGILPGVGSRFYANVNTTGNNHNFDFGLLPSTFLADDDLTLKAVVTGNNATLNWQSADETNAAKYILEKSTGGSDFKPVSEFTASGLHKYFYNYDISAEPVGTILFKVILVTKNGKRLFSNIVPVKIFNNVEVKIMPNPVTEFFSVHFFTEKNSLINIKIVNSAGHLVYMKSHTVLKGNNKIDIAAPKQMSSGAYKVIINDKKLNLYSETVLKL